MVEKLRTISQSLGFEFEYGRQDFQNLIDPGENEIYYLFVDPVGTEESLNSAGDSENVYVHSGKMMLLILSDISEIYDDTSNGKWQKHIKPITTEGGHLDILKGEIQCDGNYTITRWSWKEVVNMFDANMDGVIINYQIKEYR